MPPPHQTASLRSWGTLSPGPLTSAALLHAQPRAAPALHRRAARSSPRAATRSCPARPRLRLAGAPGPVQPPPGPSGRCARSGGGVRGASPPRGAETRKHPTSRVPARAHAGAARWRPGSLPECPHDCVCVGLTRSARDSSSGSRSIPAGARGPAATGHCSSTKSQGAAPAPPPPLL